MCHHSPAMPTFLMWVLGIKPFQPHYNLSVTTHISSPGLGFIMSAFWPAHSSLLGFALPTTAEATALSSYQSLVRKHQSPHPPLRPCPCCPSGQIVRWNSMSHQQPSVSHSLPIPHAPGLPHPTEFNHSGAGCVITALTTLSCLSLVVYLSLH